MSLIAAALMLASAPEARGDAPASSAAERDQAAAPRALGAAAARAWVALVDGGDWSGSWRAAGTLFRTRLPEQQWASVIGPVRTPLGTVSSRAFRSVVKAASLPGAPEGEYEIIEFQTRFAAREAVETIVAAREGSDWKVVGYFIR